MEQRHSAAVRFQRVPLGPWSPIEPPPSDLRKRLTRLQEKAYSLNVWGANRDSEAVRRLRVLLVVGKRPLEPGPGNAGVGKQRF